MQGTKRNNILQASRNHTDGSNEKSVNKQCLLDTPPHAQCQCDLENEVKVTEI